MVFDWSAAASWVQAIGSLGAIWAAFMIFSHQSRAESRRERDAAKARQSAVRAVLERCKEAVIRAHNKMTRNGKFAFGKGNIAATEEDLDECLALLCDLPLLDLPNEDLVRRVMGARYWLAVARRRTKIVRDCLENGEALDSSAYKDPLAKIEEFSTF
jgi:hypothetical protein